MLVALQDRNVLKFPGKTANKFPRSSAQVFLARIASQCRGRCQGSSALIHHSNSAGTVQGQQLVKGLPIDQEYSIISIHRWKTI